MMEKVKDAGMAARSTVCISGRAQTVTGLAGQS